MSDFSIRLASFKDDLNKRKASLSLKTSYQAGTGHYPVGGRNPLTSDVNLVFMADCMLSSVEGANNPYTEEVKIGMLDFWRGKLFLS